MDYIYILVNCDGDSWNPRPYDVGHYRTEESAVNAVPEYAREMEIYAGPRDDHPSRLTIRHFNYFRVDRVALLD